MKKRYRLMIVSLLAVCLLSAGCGTTEKKAEKTASIEINVSAALGLKEALVDIQKKYEKAHPEAKIVYNFAAAGVLASQIENGAPCDIFLSAAIKQVNDLKAKGLLQEDTIKDIVGNRLVLAVPRGNPLQLKNFKDLTKESVHYIGFGDIKTMPAGQYGKECLENIGIWQQVEPKFVVGKTVREIVAYVESGNADAAVAFETVVINNPKVEIAAFAPEGTHQTVLFPGAMLKNTKNEMAVRSFFDYLTSADALDIFQKYGFSSLKKE
ncbi:MAG: molybdate ABC transporter substrate-binding protein [Selenomonadaceae bacterium]